MTPTEIARHYRRCADECEAEAAQVVQLAEVRQFRVLAQAWRELADLHETLMSIEPIAGQRRD